MLLNEARRVKHQIYVKNEFVDYIENVFFERRISSYCYVSHQKRMEWYSDCKRTSEQDGSKMSQTFL